MNFISVLELIKQLLDMFFCMSVHRECMIFLLCTKTRETRKENKTKIGSNLYRKRWLKGVALKFTIFNLIIFIFIYNFLITKFLIIILTFIVTSQEQSTNTAIT
jgi:cobalamin synthase